MSFRPTEQRPRRLQGQVGGARSQTEHRSLRPLPSHVRVSRDQSPFSSHEVTDSGSRPFSTQYAVPATLLEWTRFFEYKELVSEI